MYSAGRLSRYLMVGTGNTYPVDCVRGLNLWPSYQDNTRWGLITTIAGTDTWYPAVMLFQWWMILSSQPPADASVWRTSRGDSDAWDKRCLCRSWYKCRLVFWNGWWWRPWLGHWYRSQYYNWGWVIITIFQVSIWMIWPRLERILQRS